MADGESWVRAPRQARSQETMDRFVQATTELLDERPFEEITVADIVARAGRTEGSFYARFDDKQAVLHLLIEQLHARARDVTRAFCDPVRWEGSPVGEFVAESVRLNVQAYRRAGPLFRAALVASATDERFRQRRLETLRACADLQKAFLLERVDELSCAMPSRAADRAFELLVARLDHELLFGRFTATCPANDLELVDELSEACLHVLGAQPAPAGATDEVPVVAI
jgi:AcrR family transcriptional regulator